MFNFASLPTWLYAFAFALAMNEFLLLHHLTQHLMRLYFKRWPLEKVHSVSLCFPLYFPDDMIWSLFSYIICCLSSFSEVSVMAFGPFKYNYLFPYYSVIKFLCTFLRYVLCKCFLLAGGLLFIPLTISFAVENF